MGSQKYMILIKLKQRIRFSQNLEKSDGGEIKKKIVFKGYI
jgi:hypothetical protein